MSMYAREFEYANTRLAGTYCLKDGKPTRVEMVMHDGNVMCQRLDGEEFVCNLDDLQVKGIKLGYINTPATAMFLARVPKRRDWRQGLRAANVVIINRGKVAKVHNGTLHEMMMHYDKQFLAARSVLARSSQYVGGKHLAWSRDWCAAKRGLYYRGSRNPVATYDNEKRRVTMLPGYHHLKESLERSVNDDRIEIIVG